MYPHSENNCSDNVQLLAPDFDPNIDEDTQPTLTTSTQAQSANNHTINANNTKEKNTQLHQSQQHSDWPDSPTVQISTVSLIVQDHSCIATAHMVQEQDPCRVEYNVKSRKTRNYDNDTLMLSSNLTTTPTFLIFYIYYRMPKPYKGTPFRRIVHQKNATPKFQPTDRDIQAQK